METGRSVVVLHRCSSIATPGRSAFRNSRQHRDSAGYRQSPRDATSLAHEVIGTLTLQRDVLRLQKLLINRMGWSRHQYVEQRRPQYRSMWEQVCGALGGSFTELAADLWQIELGDRRARILNYQLEFDDPVTLGLAGRKSVVHRLLRDAGLHVPEHKVFTLDRLEEARRFVEEHPQGCVIKPASGYGGKGVTTHIGDVQEVRGAAVLASVYDDELLVEVMVPGESYRLLVLEGRVVDAVYRRGFRLEGDGRSTIRELLATAASRRAARNGALDVDRDCLFTLAAQGLSLDSRPSEGRSFLARSVVKRSRPYAELRTVYTDSALGLVSDEIRSEAEAAARIVGSDFLGVDVITLDPSMPLGSNGGAINEVNTTPALHHHYDPRTQPYPAAAVLAVQALLERQQHD